MVASLVCLSVRLRVCFVRRPYWCPAALALSHPWHSATIGSVAPPFGVLWRSAPLAHSPQYSVIYGAQPLSRSRGVAPVSHSGALGGSLLLLASCCARLVCRSEPFSVLLPSSALFLALAFRPSALAFPGSPLAQPWRSTVISHFGIPWRSLAISRSGAQLFCISCSCALRRSALALSSGALWRSPAPGAIRRSAALVLIHSVVPRPDRSPHIVRCFQR